MRTTCSQPSFLRRKLTSLEKRSWLLTCSRGGQAGGQRCGSGGGGGGGGGGNRLHVCLCRGAQRPPSLCSASGWVRPQSA